MAQLNFVLLIVPALLSTRPIRPQINLQTVLLMSQHFTRKEIGTLLFVFGWSQVIFMAPIGYIYDKLSGSVKLNVVIGAGTLCSIVTVLTAILASNRNMTTHLVLKVIQGATSAIQLPGLNSITLGIVGAPGFTRQVARNHMMRHIGSAINVGLGSLLAYFLYPSVGPLFVVSPLFCVGLVYFVRKIEPEQIDTDAARALIEHSSTMDEYAIADATSEALWKALQEKRREAGTYVAPNSPNSPGESTYASSSAFGFGPGGSPEIDWDDAPLPNTPHASNLSNVGSNTMVASQQPTWGCHEAVSGHIFEASEAIREAISPIVAIFSKNVLLFCGIIFGFHLSNSAILPLVMQQVQLYDAQSSALLSGLCILLAQSIMMIMSKLVGDYSPRWGRKHFLIICLFSLPVRCFVLATLTTYEDRLGSAVGRHICKVLILSTQLFDAVGSGILGTLYILITNDLSRGTGRFSLLLGIVTAFMCLGCTFSSVIGAYLAADFGVDIALNVLGLMSLVPAFVCLFQFPETHNTRRKKKKRRRQIGSLLASLRRGSNPFSPQASPFTPHTLPPKQVELV